ncbi:MAG: polymer-forming cytoskeletal protein [Acidobacteriota bacterium]|nr:polymer-forming cytoskeletal protein [Acidobacteriota bacterium]
MWKPSTSSGNTTPTADVKRPATPVANPPVPEYNNTPAPRAASLAGTGTGEQASIGKALIVKGEVSGSESLFIDGRVEGSIHLPGHRVTVGRNGTVDADVVAREIVILGKVNGNVTASDRVDIRNEGTLVGDVIAQRISIEDGAFFKGGIDIRKAAGEEKAARAV